MHPTLTSLGTSLDAPWLTVLHAANTAFTPTRNVGLALGDLGGVSCEARVLRTGRKGSQ